jgi:hypothetical protein
MREKSNPCTLRDVRRIPGYYVILTAGDSIEGEGLLR